MKPLRSLSIALLAVVTATPLSSLAAHAQKPPRIKIEDGKLEGKLSADSNVRIFLGIPFAAPPVGPLRWKPPQPAARWKGVRQATTFGSRCMQPTVNADMVFHDPGISEDCLTLNVWAPASAKKGQPLPVMVWIYGGGFTTGSTSEGRQEGEQFARNGVILVSMNYRMGVFGFFAHPALAAESPQHAAGNYGLMDEAAALLWTQRNIKAFGGDPRNITVFGESAGSFAVSAMMASPMVRGTLARAIGESGAAFSRSGLSFPPLAVSEKQGEIFARDVLGKTSLADLRSIPAEDLLKAVNNQHPPAVRFGPDIDGYFLTESVPAIFAAGKQAHIPLLAGWNLDEASSQVVKMNPQPTLASYREMAQKTYGPQADQFLKAYPAETDEEAIRRTKDLAADHFIAASTWEWIEAHVKTGNAPVYRYKFDRPSPGDPNHPATSGAFHSDEIEYVFNVLDSRAGAAWKPEDYALSKQMQSYWINFARTGDPNRPGLPQWPRYAPEDFPVMHLNATSAASPTGDRDRYIFLKHFAESAKPAAQ